MYDTSVKVPGLFMCPGTIPAGVVTKAQASHYDVYETILDFAGIEFEKTPDMPGESFLSVLLGKEDTRGEDVFVYDEYGKTRMVTDGKLKLVYRYPDGPNELYDTVNDPDEYNNLYGDPEYAEKTQALIEKLESWFSKYVNPSLDGRLENVRGAGQITSHSFC